ncbi:MAG: murein biosynthesis integral membrane protein MurJ [Verrucomicrobiales bacterium]|nr:murein biosynthesis integral membrane protein MurJ [Verrucomicrobiales bacterium]
MSKMLKSSGSVGAATLISRFLGFLREAVYAGFMGISPVADAFYYAYSLPNLLRRLLGEGALTAAFIPIFKDRERNHGDATMWRSVNAVLCALVLLLGAVVLVAMLVLAWIILRVPLQFRTELSARLMLVMFPYVGFVCMAAVFIGLLNARGHYFMPALGAAVLNVVMIASVYFLAPRFGQSLDRQVFGLAVGVVIAGFLQAAVQVPMLRRDGFRFAWVNPFQDPTVREVARKMGPATLGVAAYQLNVVVTQTLAVAEAKNVLSAFNYAVRLMELPQGVVGVSLATYLLSELSGLAAEKKFPEFRGALRDGLQQLVFINTLATVILLVLARPIIRLLFEHGKFTAEDTGLSSQALWALAPGLVFFSLNSIYSRAFYAMGDTRTPMRISVFALVVNLMFAFFLIPLFHQAGMGLANTLSAAFNTVLLIYALRRALPRFGVGEVAGNLPGILAAAAAATAVAAGLCLAFQHWLGLAGWMARSVTVFGSIAGASAAYFGTALVLRLPQAAELSNFVRSRLARRHPRPGG